MAEAAAPEKRPSDSVEDDDAPALVEIPGMDIEGLVKSAVDEATKDVLGEDVDLERGEEAAAPKGPRPLSDMSSMELLMRDTRAYIAQLKAERRLRRRFLCATACGTLMAVLQILLLLPVWLFLNVYAVVRYFLPEAPKREAPVQPSFYDPAAPIKKKKKKKRGMADVVNSASERGGAKKTKKMTATAVPKGGKKKYEVPAR